MQAIELRQIFHPWIRASDIQIQIHQQLSRGVLALSEETAKTELRNTMGVAVFLDVPIT
jgi:hypothetical protein